MPSLTPCSSFGGTKVADDDASRRAERPRGGRGDASIDSERASSAVTRLNDIDCDVKSGAHAGGGRWGGGGQMWGDVCSCEESVDRRARHSRMQTLIKHTTNRLATTSSCAQFDWRGRPVEARRCKVSSRSSGA